MQYVYTLHTYTLTHQCCHTKQGSALSGGLNCCAVRCVGKLVCYIRVYYKCITEICKDFTGQILEDKGLLNHCNQCGQNLTHSTCTLHICTVCTQTTYTQYILTTHTLHTQCVLTTHTILIYTLITYISCARNTLYIYNIRNTQCIYT